MTKSWEIKSCYLLRGSDVVHLTEFPVAFSIYPKRWMQIPNWSNQFFIQSMCTYYVCDKRLFLIFCPLRPSLSLCCFSHFWHLNSKAAFKWRWMAELPHTINKASYVCLREGHVLYTILSLFHTVTVHSLILCEQNTVGCSKWRSTVFIRAYAVSSWMI